jgi:hypothetical protein
VLFSSSKAQLKLYFCRSPSPGVSMITAARGSRENCNSRRRNRGQEEAEKSSCEVDESRERVTMMKEEKMLINFNL